MKENPIHCILVISVLLLQLAQSTALPPPSENPSPPVQSKHKPTFLLTIILVSIIVVMAFVFVYLHSHFFGGPRLPRTASALAATGGLLAGDSLDADVLNTFPTFVYSEVKALKIGMGGLECAVCLNEFEDDETLRLIPHCSHAFHSDCIDKWLSSHVTCPVCRADVTNVLSSTVQSPNHWRGEKSARETTSDAVVEDEIVIPIELEAPIPSRFTTKISGMLDHHVVPSGSGGKSVAVPPVPPVPVVVKPGDEWDRYTLRLPEEVQSRLMRSRMNRTRSCVVFGRAKSSRKEEIKMGSVGQGRVYKNFLFLEQSD